MYADDHNPPHVHIISPDFRVRVEIGSLKVIDRGASKKQLAEPLKYVAENLPGLALKWIELNERE